MFSIIDGYLWQILIRYEICMTGLDPLSGYLSTKKRSLFDQSKYIVINFVLFLRITSTLLFPTTVKLECMNYVNYQQNHALYEYVQFIFSALKSTVVYSALRCMGPPIVWMAKWRICISILNVGWLGLSDIAMIFGVNSLRIDFLVLLANGMDIDEV